jgi:hypothetical protein
MQISKADHLMASSSPKTKLIYTVIILAFLLVVALYIYNAYRAFQPAALPANTVMISQSVMEEKYGLHVNLVAVTGAGGFVDLRLKMVDGEKAKLLLGDKKNFPALYSVDGLTLNAPEDTKSQKIEFITGGNLFIMYPNSSNAVLRDKPVTIMFGDIALEPIMVK